MTVMSLVLVVATLRKPAKSRSYRYSVPAACEAGMVAMVHFWSDSTMVAAAAVLMTQPAPVTEVTERKTLAPVAVVPSRGVIVSEIVCPARSLPTTAMVPSVSVPVAAVWVTVISAPPAHTGLALATVYAPTIMLVVVTIRLVTAAVVAEVGV